MKRTIFLLDTNVLLHDPSSIFSFPQGEVGLHFCVLEELDSFKKETTDRGYNARESTRILNEISNIGSLTQGITLGNGGKLKIFMPINFKFNGLSSDKNDEKIILLALYLKEIGEEVILVSQDFNMRIRAACVGIEVMDYKNESISKENFYLGWKEFFFQTNEIKINSPKLLGEILNENEFFINEFVLLKSLEDNNYYRIFRYKKDGKFHEVKNDKNRLWGLTCKNEHQEMALDLLLDDDIKLVILCGPSGTGKTFLVLASMLYKILCDQIYQKLLVSRPLVALGADIGFLPGDLYEKLQTWMQPVRDNLEYLVYHINSFPGNICYNPCDEHFSKKRSKKRWQQEENKRYMHVEDLIGAHGKIALEAITYMRGRSIPNQVIFIDEVQNLTPHEVKTLISRAGEGSKIILAGDPYQIDCPYLDFVTNGLVVASEKFKGQSVFGSVYLQISERSILSSLANELM